MIIVNPDKFQAIIIDKKKENKTHLYKNKRYKHHLLKISVRLLGLKIDNQLNFDKHIAQLGKKVPVS